VIPYEDHDTLASVYIPNALSPNGDGDNDMLKFYLQDKYCLKDFAITIYDRWGEKVYETTDINSAWDGTYNGHELNSAVFSYYCKTITATGRQVMRKGNISLVR
jgi:gliding motility-associated-like protein